MSATSQTQILLEKIQTHQAKVGVVGLGYVGLPFAVEKGKVGFRVTGIDFNAEKVAMVNAGQNYIEDVVDEELRELVKKGLIRAVDTFDCIADLDVIVICVPTPLTKNLTPDLSYVESVTREVAKKLRVGQLVSLESTTYPGTTEELMLPILAESGLVPDQDFFVAHSPERVDPGNQRYTTKNTNKVVGGMGPNSKDVAVAFYQQTIDHVVPVSSAKAAELVQVYENTFRAVNIALVNEMALLCDKLELNVWEVLDAAFTKPFGIMPFYPGPGVGGHCIPLDPHYLEWKAKEYNFNTRFVALAGSINRQMPYFVREKIQRALNKVGKAPSRSKLLFVGVSYKKDLADERESPAFPVIDLLLEDSATIVYHDPFIPQAKIGDTMQKSIALTPENIASADAVVIITDHTDLDYSLLEKHALVIVDTRNAMARAGIESDKIIIL